MTEIILAIFFITVLLLFLSSGVWVALSMIGVSAIAMELFTSRPVGDAMATTIWGMSSSWTLTALPLFVWMGEILFRTKLSENLFEGLSPWMQKLPGGLIHVNVVGCAIFAAISGSSAATVATVGKMSIPELRKRNYPEKILNKKNIGGDNVIECKVRNGKHKAYYMTMKRDLKYGALLKKGDVIGIFIV